LQLEDEWNLELQGKNKCIAEMISTVSCYKRQFELIMTDLTNNTFGFQPSMQIQGAKILIKIYIRHEHFFYSFCITNLATRVTAKNKISLILFD
jgi:hypothetical protein